MFMKKTITLLSAAVLLAVGVKAQTTVDTSKKEEIPSFVEQMPEFPGGTENITPYLAANIRYPKEAQESGLEGRVLLRFIVMEDGSLTDIKSVKHVGGGLDEEAIRVVKAMPKWNPGKQDGKAVKVYYQLPITFHLE